MMVYVVVAFGLWLLRQCASEARPALLAALAVPLRGWRGARPPAPQRLAVPRRALRYGQEKRLRREEQREWRKEHVASELQRNVVNRVACVQWWERGLEAGGTKLGRKLRYLARQPPRSLRVASLGGGPGNDAAGFALFASEVLHVRTMLLDVFDFSDAWRPYCAAAMAAVAEECRKGSKTRYCSHFGLADLQLGLQSAVNAALRNEQYDIFVLSYCIHESRAYDDARHPLLRDLLAGAEKGTLFVLLEASAKTIDAVLDMLRRQAWTVRILHRESETLASEATDVPQKVKRST